jgi:hypothetical protein
MDCSEFFKQLEGDVYTTCDGWGVDGEAMAPADPVAPEGRTLRRKMVYLTNRGTILSTDRIGCCESGIYAGGCNDLIPAGLASRCSLGLDRG